jgi:hypothetical protein
MDCCGWRWIAGSLDDSGMPLLTHPTPPSNIDELESRMTNVSVRSSRSRHRERLTTWLHRCITRFRGNRRVVVAQHVRSDTDLSLEQRDASQQTRAA